MTLRDASSHFYFRIFTIAHIEVKFSTLVFSPSSYGQEKEGSEEEGEEDEEDQEEEIVFQSLRRPVKRDGAFLAAGKHKPTPITAPSSTSRPW
ncbi:MAG: hypothetical protein WCV62_01075 [Candidatus Peribacteraceae bacterium]|jgi:hypothetical protein